jgi:hypothetical protein
MSRLASILNRFPSLTAALEGHVEPSVPAVEVSERDSIVTLEAAQAALESAAVAADKANTHSDDLQIASVGLEAIAAELEAAAGAGGMTKQAAEVMLPNAISCSKHLGMNSPMVQSMESFNNPSTRMQATRISMETVGETLKKVWEMVLKAIAAAWDAVMSFFDKLFDVAPKIKARAEQLTQKAATMHGSPQGKIKVDGLTKSFVVGPHSADAMDMVDLYRTLAHDIEAGVLSIIPFPMQIFTKEAMASEEGRARILQMIVTSAKDHSKGIPGINKPMSSTDTHVSFESAILPGLTRFVLTYELPTMNDSVSSAIRKAMVGPSVSMQSALEYGEVMKQHDVEPLELANCVTMLKHVVDLADLAIASKAEMERLKKSMNAKFEGTRPPDGDYAANLDEAAMNTYTAALGRRVTGASRLSYKIYKYGADAMKCYLDYAQKSMAAIKDMSNSEVKQAADEAQARYEKAKAANAGSGDLDPAKATAELKDRIAAAKAKQAEPTK